MTNTASARGKIILSGEYAVAFGYPGIAMPVNFICTVSFKEEKSDEWNIQWNTTKGNSHWDTYIRSILQHLGAPKGTLSINNEIPLGKGMGASSAFVVALTRMFHGENFDSALEVENAVNPGHSGIDLLTIWNEKVLLYKKPRAPQMLDQGFDLSNAVLIDTGTPDQSTVELVKWVHERKEELKDALEMIGQCTERLLQSEGADRDLHLRSIIRDHHKAQCALGVVPDAAHQLIDDIENAGGCAKVAGAGSRTGGGGMVLALHEEHSVLNDIAAHHHYYDLHRVQ